MTDTISVPERSRVMSRVKAKHTGPEMQVRRLIYGAGYRYRLYGAKLPGKPDLVFAGRRKVIFVNGCFWHRHEGCSLARIPKSHREFWEAKLEGNKARDLINYQKLREMGWKVMVVWECELRDLDGLLRRVVRFLAGPGR